jgi:hypothetical protein
MERCERRLAGDPAKIAGFGVSGLRAGAAALRHFELGISFNP